MAGATGRVGYMTRVQDCTRVAYPTRPVALATGQKPCPKQYIQTKFFSQTRNSAFSNIKVHSFNIEIYMTTNKHKPSFAKILCRVKPIADEVPV